MKTRIVISALAVLTFFSCSKSEMYPVVDTPEYISFSTYASTATKAGSSLIQSGTQLPVDAIFGVYSYQSKEGSFEGVNEAPDFMNNVSVNYQPAQTKSARADCSYAPAKQWPDEKSGKALSFFAYYPKVENSGISSKVSKGLGAFQFSVNEDASKQVDFLVSDVVADQTVSSNAGNVQFKFSHMLTRVRFSGCKSIKDDNTVVTIKSVTLKNVYSSGTLTPVYDQLSETTTFEWGNLNDKKDFALPVSESGVAMPSFPKSVEVSDNTSDGLLLMIPQSLDGVQIEVLYTTKTGSDAEVTNLITKNLSSMTKSDGVDSSWDINKTINMGLVIGLNPIEFSASVSDWFEL